MIYANFSNEPTNSSTILPKNIEFCREFINLPNILVQDPVRNCAYYIKAPELEKYKLTAENMLSISHSTVTFIIPDKDLIDEIPAFLASPDVAPAVLIQFNRTESSYLLQFEDLQNFRIEQPTESFDNNCVSFIIPKGLELIEELPAMRRGLLQSNTG